MAPKGYCEKLQGWLTQIRVPVYILVIFFAMASWIDINGLWTQVPLLVNKLPEAWNLPSYLIIIIQIANIGPIIYTSLNRLAPNKVKEWPVVYIIIFVGAVACFLLIFFWDHTSHVFGEERSSSLLVLSFFLAFVDTTSSVVFLPYMANFKVQYMTAFYIGEGFSGLLPALVGLIQGVGSDPDCRNVSSTVFNETTGENITEWSIQPFYDDPLFSVEVFFVFLFAMLLVSAICFTCLNFTNYCKQEMIIKMDEVIVDDFAFENKAYTMEDSALKNGKSQPNYSSNENSQDNSTSKFDIATRKPRASINLDSVGIDKDSLSLNKFQFFYLFLTSVLVNGLGNGVIPSTGSYSALPYSNRAYNLSTRLGMAANPIACFTALLLPCKSLIGLGVIVLTSFAAAVYQLYLAAMSPYPPLQGEAAGEFLAVSMRLLHTLTKLFE